METQIRALKPQSINQQPPLKTTLVFGKPYRRVKYLIFLVSCLCLAPFYYGFTLTYISTIGPKTLGDFFGSRAGTSTMYGVLIGITPIGAGVGALLAPIFMNFLSRKNFMLFFNAVALMISGIIQINNLSVLLACRFVQGFVIGNYMGVTPIYIKQLTPVPLRGSVGAMSQFFNIGAVVVCYFFGLVFDLAQVNKQFFWRFMFSFTALTIILQSVLLIFNVIPQSPSSLIEAGHLREAKRVLAIFNNADVLDNVFSEYIKQSRRNKFVIRYRRKQPQMKKYHSENYEVEMSSPSVSQPVVLFDVKDDFQLETGKGKGNIMINPSFERRQSTTSDDYTIQIQTVYSKRGSINPDLPNAQPHPHKQEQHLHISIKAFIIGFEIPLMQQFSGVKTIVTEIGIIIYEYDRSLSVYSPFLINVVQLIATACSILVLARFGRRPILLAGNLGVAICSLIVGFFFLAMHINGDHSLVFGAMGFIIAFMIIYGLTIGPAVWLYVPEIIPAKIVPPATFMNWLGVSISVIVTPIVIEEVHSPYPVFLFFGAISLVFFVMNWFMVVETKGLEPSQIAEKLA